MNERRDKVLGRLLVVDDVEMNRDTLSRRMTRVGHRVDVAENGAKALEMIASNDYDLVFLDVMMPQMSGLEVLTRVRQEKTADELPIIMATAKSASEDIVNALNLGANDYVTKPLDFAVVRARAQTQLSLKQASASLAEANHRMKQSLEAAAKVQLANLPDKVEVDGYQFAWRFIPCDELAGDGLNIIPVDNSVVICMWDVSGHGVPAALLSVSVANLLNPGFGRSSIMMSNGWTSLKLSPPSEVARGLNQGLQMAEHGEQFLTLCYGILDATSGTFSYINAGHPNPIHLSHDGQLHVHKLTGQPVGVMEDSECRYETGQIQLVAGDRLYIYTDGFDEASNTDGNPIGVHRLQQSLLSLRHLPLDESLDEITSQLKRWQNSDRFKDDLSIIGIERRKV